MTAIPDSLQYSGATYVRAGHGQMKALAFFCTVTGHTIELFESVCIDTTAQHDVLTVIGGGEELTTVHIAKNAMRGKARCLAAGDHVLCGPISPGKPPHAQAVWPLESANRARSPRRAPIRAGRPWATCPPRPARPPRLRGIVTAVAKTGTFGFIQGVDGRRYFVHGGELLPGTPFIPGTTVTFITGSAERGPTARAVHLA